MSPSTDLKSKKEIILLYVLPGYVNIKRWAYQRFTIDAKDQWATEDIAKTRNAIMAKLSERAIPSKLIGVEEQYG